MSNRWSLKGFVSNRPIWNNQKPWLSGGLYLVSVILAFAVLVLLFERPIINGYGKGKLERGFAEAYPGATLQISELKYTLGANRLVAEGVTLHGKTSTIKIGHLSMMGVRWLRLLKGGGSPEVLSKAGIEATNFEMEFPRSRYGIRCAKLRAAVPVSELMVEGLVLHSLTKDETRFAKDPFRTTRFHVVVPECSVVGLAYGDLLQEKSYRAQAIHLSRPSLDALVNRDKPVKPSGKPQPMVNEALASIGLPVQLDHLRITDGHIKYAERIVAGSAPGVLTFTEVMMDAEDISNRGEKSAAIRLKAQGRLLDAGLLKVQMKIPLMSPGFSLQYSGSLGAMDMTRLNAFLESAERTRIKSGSVKQVTFTVEVAANRAHGHVRAIYKDLKITVLDRKTGTVKGLDNRIASFIANTFTIQRSSAPYYMKEGEVDYRRRPDDTFIQVVWFSLRSGVLKVIHR